MLQVCVDMLCSITLDINNIFSSKYRFYMQFYYKEWNTRMTVDLVADLMPSHWIQELHIYFVQKYLLSIL